MPGSAPAFEFGPFRLEPDERRLVRDGDPVTIAPKAFDLLVFMVERGGRLLKKEELMEHLWPGVFVEEVNLAQNISAIRRVLGGDGRDAYIQTVAGAGYRFVAAVRETPGPGAEDTMARADRERAGTAKRARLIVLPFRMLKPDADLEFLTFSLPDALTASLSSIDAVIVRSSLVAARFTTDAPDLARIARDAQVDLVVSGTLLRAGDQLRVSAQLSDASAGTLIWSQTDQAPVGDLFRLQDSLVERIAGSLTRPLSGGDRDQLRRDVPASPLAYEYYLRANQASQFVNGMSFDGAAIVRDLYLQAVHADPQYAPAWARLARIYRVMGKYRPGDAAANLARADEALQRALELNADLSMAHNLYAQIEVDRGRAADAMVRLLQRLERRGPHAEVYAGLVHACRFCGLLDASIAAHAQAQRLDPALGTSAMHTYFVLRRYDDVIRVSGDVKGYVYALSLAAVGRQDEALAFLPATPPMLAAARALLEGRRDDSVAAMTAAAQTFADPEAHFNAGRHFAHLGQRRLALDALTRAIDGGYFCEFGLAGDPWFGSVRDDAAFQLLLQRAGEGRAAAERSFRDADGPKLLTGATTGL